MSPDIQLVNLFNFNRRQLADWLVEQGEPSYRASQILQWMHQKRTLDFTEMSNLSKALRERLPTQACVQLPEMALRKKSNDGTVKWLFRLADGNCIETVYIPENQRGTLCISSQVGCALNCQFCSTGKQGFNRDLNVAEIISQLWLAKAEVNVTNVVMMGMGEPLMNYQNVLAAMDIMLDDLAYGLSKYRVTLSTSGVVPELKQLKQQSPVALAVSLHAANDTLRDQIVPINRKYPLAELLAVCRDYYANEPRRAVTFEYVMLAGVNDQPQHAAELVKLLKGVRCKINLIPFNPFPNTEYRCSASDVIEKFRDLLGKGNLFTTVRRTRGEDIDGACGQLVGEVKARIPLRVIREQQARAA